MKNVDFSSRFVWDKWQKEVLTYHGNIVIRSGRQVGKSEVVAEKVVRFALQHDNTTSLVIAASQRQAGLLFEKVKLRLYEIGGDAIFSDKPTLTKLLFVNGSKIFCLPAGKTGSFIRGFTLDLLVVDEAAYVSEAVYTSIVPMIAVSRRTRGFGYIVLLSTPCGKSGFYFECFRDADFKSWHVSSLDCERIDRRLIEKERRRLSKVAFAQEWLGEFVDDHACFFRRELVRERTTFKKWDLKDKVEGSSFYLGVDVARYGGDENSFVVVELVGGRDRELLKAVVAEKTDMVSTVDTIGRVVAMDEKFKFRKIFVDDNGVGGGVTDVLIAKLGRKVVGLNNASKRVEVVERASDGLVEKKRGILKEDLYSNVLVLLEQGRLDLIDDGDLQNSLWSMTFEYTQDWGRLRIFGRYSHLCEALVRACWCVKERGLEVALY